MKASLWRFKHILAVIVHHAFLHAIHQRIARWPRFARRLAGEGLSGPKRFRLVIEEIGGTFIKFGQMLAMQSDLLPLEYCAALSSLFDQVASFPYAEVEKILVEDLQRTPSELFDSFETQPIATGSIGQVHVATIRGQKMAVKVRRPTIISDFNADIAALKFTVAAVRLLRLRALYWIIAPTQEFIAWTQEELDYRREAYYMDELRRNARENEHEKVPAVYWSYTTTRILTVEFIEGITVSEYLRQREKGESPQTGAGFVPNIFAGRLVDNFLGDAFRHGMFHADLHPGNLIILGGNVVGYIDFGISGVLSRYSRRHLIAMTLAYARGDLEAMCESFFHITTFDKNVDLLGFRRGLKEAASRWYGDREGEGRLRKSITSIMLELLLLSKKYGIWPQRDVVKYIRSAIALDGLVKTFAPGMDIGRHLEEACERHIQWDSARSLLTPETVSGWFGGGTHLARDGFLRAFALLQRAATDASTPPLVRDEIQGAKLKRRAWLGPLQLGWIALCLLMNWAPRQDSVGLLFRVAMPAVVLLLAWQIGRRWRMPVRALNVTRT